MNKNTDHKADLEYIRAIFDADDTKAPDSLSEESILAMLPDRAENLTPEQEELLAGPEENAPGKSNKLTSADFKPVTSKKKPSLKKIIAIAACAVVALIGTGQVVDMLNAPPDTQTADGELYVFRNRTEIERLVKSLDTSESRMYNGDFLTEDAAEDTGAADSDMVVLEESAPLSSNEKSLSGGEARTAPKASAAGSAESDHSETYLQVDEVDEADIIKTDGKYIYYVTSGREVVILEADKGKTKVLSRIGTTDIENYVHDIFLKGDTLVTVGRFYDEDDGYTGIVTYDISDRKDPKMIASFRQTGEIVSSRMVGDYVYLVTTDYVYRGGRMVPKCTVDGEYKEMAADSICCVPSPTVSSYIVLSSVDIASGKQSKCKTSAIFGATDDIYCNDHNLYAVVREWDTEAQTDYTRIVRASLDGLNIRFNATAKVRGFIDDQFSMDEKDGYFRIATTGERDGIDVNNLFVLDDKLKEVGKVTGFARNESIKSVRYFGDKAYVITYEQIDPLFIIDLSDPTRPKIDGEVKIDGFSTLLVPAGEGKLLGIGYATGDNGYGGEYSAGLKLVLFDISDPSEPKVIDSKEFKDMDSPAQITHKALTVNSGKGWYAIPYSIYHYDDVIDDDEPVVIDEGIVYNGAQVPDESAGTDDAESSDIDVITEDPETGEDVDVTTEEPENVEDIYYEDNESYLEAGVLVFGADDKLSVYDQHELAHEELTRSVYIGDYIYALDYDGNVSSFKFSK